MLVDGSSTNILYWAPLLFCRLVVIHYWCLCRFTWQQISWYVQCSNSLLLSHCMFTVHSFKLETLWIESQIKRDCFTPILERLTFLLRRCKCETNTLVHTRQFWINLLQIAELCKIQPPRSLPLHCLQCGVLVLCLQCCVLVLCSQCCVLVLCLQCGVIALCLQCGVLVLFLQSCVQLENMKLVTLARREIELTNASSL